MSYYSVALLRLQSQFNSLGGTEKFGGFFVAGAGLLLLREPPWVWRTPLRVTLGILKPLLSCAGGGNRCSTPLYFWTGPLSLGRGYTLCS